VALDNLQDDANRRDIGHVRGIRGAATPSADTPTPARAINNNCTRVAFIRERARIFVKGQNRPPLGNISVVAKIFASVGDNVVGTADGKAGGPTVFQDQDTVFTISVVYGGPTHLFKPNSARKT
jgi:hypothetical protein